MRIRDVFSFAFSAIRLRKLRAGLTILGVVIGIAAIVALLSLSQGFQYSMTEQLETGFATNTLTVTTQGFGFGQDRSDISLFIDDTETIDTIDKVQTSVAIIQKTCYLQVGEDAVPITVVAVDFSKYAEIYSNSFIPDSGAISLEPRDDEIVLGQRISDPWENGTLLSTVGDTVDIIWTTRSSYELTNKTYTGVVEAILTEIGGFGLGGPSDNAVYIPISQAQSFFNTNETNTIIVQLANSDDATITTVREAIQNAFSDQVRVISPTAMLETITAAFSTIELFLAGIAGISLLVAGIGIMNIMIVSLMERTREIGILKAVGMKNRTVLSIFLSESVIIGLMGAIIGIASGWSLANAFSKLGLGGGGFGGFGGRQTATMGGMNITPVLTPTLLLGAFTFGVTVSVIFALYPAWRASRLRPVEALRYE